jgi:hypothetical protein
MIPVNRVRHVVAFILTCCIANASAATCDFPIPFQYEFHSASSVSLSPSIDGSGRCALSVATGTDARTTAAGILHYRRAAPLTTVRYGFRFDTSAVTSGTSAEQVQLFSATAPVRVALPFPQSSILSVFYSNAATPTIRFLAASSGAPILKMATLSESVNVVRVEINVGARATGNVKYWINHDFTDPPEGVIETSPGAGLDNAAFVGVQGAEIGMSNPASGFRHNHPAQAIVFDQIESSDDMLFYDDFSSGAQ